MKHIRLTFFSLLTLLSCGSGVDEISDNGINDATGGIEIDQNPIGVFQRVEYIQYRDNCTDKQCEYCLKGIEGEYYLDTWACTKKIQKHAHEIPMNNGFVSDFDFLGDQIAGFPNKYAYDTLVSGSFEYIKSIKEKLYREAELVFNAEKKREIKEKESSKSIYKRGQDSAKILNKLPITNKECSHVSDGQTYTTDPPQLKCEKCGEFYKN